MTLAFPNPSRSFDAARNAVVFFGHDGMFEVRFFVQAAALARGGSRPAKAPEAERLSEAQCLTAFDSMRSSIYDVAREVYSNSRSNMNTLTATDFRC